MRVKTSHKHMTSEAIRCRTQSFRMLNQKRNTLSSKSPLSQLLLAEELRSADLRFFTVDKRKYVKAQKVRRRPFEGLDGTMRQTEKR